MTVYTETLEIEDKVSPAIENIMKSMNALQNGTVSVQNEMSKAKNSMNGLGSETSSLGSSFSSLSTEMAEATGGLSAVVEAAGAVVVGFGAVVVAGAAMALKATEAKEKMITLFDALGQGKVSGQEVNSMLDNLSSKLGIAKSDLAPLTQEFMKMGVTGQEALSTMTQAAISAKALGGGTDAAANAFVSLQQKITASAETGKKLKNPLKDMQTFGITVADVAAKMNIPVKTLDAQLKSGAVNAKAFGDALNQAVIQKGVGPLEQMSSSFDNIKKMFWDNIGKMFEDIDVKPFLSAVKDLFNVFGQAQPSGQALKSGIGGFFNQVFQTATKVIPLVKHFMLDLVIYGLKAYIALKPIVSWFMELRKNQTVMNAITNAFHALGMVILTVVAAVGVVVAIFAGLAAASVAVGVAIWSIVDTVISFVSQTEVKLAEWVKNAESAAVDFVKGLVSGITNGAGLVVDAVKNLAGGAVDTFKNALGIHSPSTVGKQLGGHFGAGVAMGTEAQAPQVTQASSSLASAAASGSPRDSGGNSSSTSHSVEVNIAPGAFVIQGADKAAEQITEEMIALIFERTALSAGL